MGFGAETLSQALLGYFGIGPNADSGFITTEVAGVRRAQSSGGFNAAVTGANISATAVPEPGVIGLFGLGLVLFAGLLQRRRSNTFNDAALAS